MEEAKRCQPRPFYTANSRYSHFILGEPTTSPCLTLSVQTILCTCMCCAYLDGGNPYSAPIPTLGSLRTTSLTSLKFSKVKYTEATEEQEILTKGTSINVSRDVSRGCHAMRENSMKQSYICLQRISRGLCAGAGSVLKTLP